MSQVLLVLVIVIVGCALIPGSQQRTALDVDNLEGAYEFVSETANITKPTNRTEVRTASDWIGLWIFQRGRFSETMMKPDRAFWLPDFPKKPADLGYESAAGTYRVDGKNVVLTSDLTMSPHFVGETTVFEYSLQGDSLTLTEIWQPSPHHATQGRRTILLRRTK